MQNDENGVGYYNIDNIVNKENRENIPNNISLSRDSNGFVKDSAIKKDSVWGQKGGEASSSVDVQAPTPPSKTNTKKMLSQIFRNENSTQKHKIKVRLQHTDQEPTEWIATMNNDPRVFRKYNNLELAREWIEAIREEFAREQGFKKPYYGKFHLHKDANGVVPGTQKEPGCFAAMSYNWHDQSWYVALKIYDFGGVFEYDYNFSDRQRSQGVKAQIVWNNPKLYKQGKAQTYLERLKSGHK